jgi:hypothetical protein
MIVSLALKLAARREVHATLQPMRIARMSCRRTFSPKAAAAFLVLVVGLTSAISAAGAGELIFSPLPRLLDFGREPNDLPPRFRTNCSIKDGRFYCAYRCGWEYEFFYCSTASFGCCHVAHGYCDYRGLLRCRP